MAKDDRVRNWTFEVYPESAPDDWKSLLDSYHIPWCCSPLHDRDTFDKDILEAYKDDSGNELLRVIHKKGDLKKPHYHVVLANDGKKSYEQELSICENFGTHHIEKVESMVGMIRYLAHLGEKNKFVYSKYDIEGHCGFDPSPYLELGATDRMIILKDILRFIKDFSIMEFQDIVDFCIENDRDDWLNVLVNYNTYALGQYIKSQRHRGGHIDVEDD